MQVFIARGEESSGPYTMDQVRAYLAEGLLRRGDARVRVRRQLFGLLRQQRDGLGLGAAAQPRPVGAAGRAVAAAGQRPEPGV